MPEVGLEPTHIATLDFESSASTIPPLRLLFYILKPYHYTIKVKLAIQGGPGMASFRIIISHLNTLLNFIYIFKSFEIKNIIIGIKT